MCAAYAFIQWVSNIIFKYLFFSPVDPSLLFYVRDRKFSRFLKRFFFPAASVARAIELGEKETIKLHNERKKKKK